MTDETGSQTNTEQTQQRRKSGTSPFIGVLVGGFLAGGVGYLSAYYTEFGLFNASDDAPLAELSQTLDAQAGRLAEIESRIAEAPGSEDEALREDVGAISGQLSELAARLETLETGEEDGSEPVDLTPTNDRVSAVEEQIAALRTQAEQMAADDGQAEQVKALTEQVSQLSARIEEQAATLEAQNQTLTEQAKAIDEAGAAATREANRVSANAALTGIDAALTTGRPYSDEIGALRSALSDVTVPDALEAPASKGVATLADLTDSFPDAARNALSASVAATAGEGVVDRFGAFLRAQTNARSLDEREGDSADAILSRAERRLAEGDLNAALAEIETLPEEGKQAMSDWLDQARTRSEALAGYSDLSSSVTDN